MNYVLPQNFVQAPVQQTQAQPPSYRAPRFPPGYALPPRPHLGLGSASFPYPSAASAPMAPTPEGAVVLGADQARPDGLDARRGRGRGLRGRGGYM